MDENKKKTKWKILLFTKYDLKAIEDFLEAEAERGWTLVKCMGMFFKFEECQPVRLKYRAAYYGKKHCFGRIKTEELKPSIERYKEIGWHYKCSIDEIQVFYSFDLSIKPGKNDESMRFKLAVKSSLKSEAFVLILIAFIILTQIMFSFGYQIYAIRIADQDIVMSWLAWLMFAALEIARGIRFGIFYFANKTRIKKDEPIKYYGLINAKVLSNLTSATVIFMVIVTLLCFRMETIPEILHTNKSIKVGDTIYFFSTDYVRPMLKDLGVFKPKNFIYEDTYKESNTSFLAKYEESSDHYNTQDKSIGYSFEMFSSKYASIMNKYKEHVINDQRYDLILDQELSKEWQVDAIYYEEKGHSSFYMIETGKRIITISGEEMNREQIKALYKSNTIKSL